MTLVYACIAPHGGELIPALAGKQLGLFSPTRAGMRVLAARMRNARPETIVVATPHNLRLQKHIGVVMSENSSGKVAEGKKQVSLSTECDLDLGQMVIDESERRGLPVVGANYGGLEGSSSDLAMDWGSLVPLWFMKKEAGIQARVLIVTPARGIPLNQNFEFGEVVGEVVRAEKKRVAFIASSDQAHAHRKDGPYGFSPGAKKYDEMVVKAISSDSLKSIMSASRRLVETAKPDSLWQMTVLAGVLAAVPMTGILVSYQVPTYYGMLCASYTRRN